MSLKRNDLASADGPYIMGPDGVEVKPIKYLELVKVLKEANSDGDVYVEGLDSHARFWVRESSLTLVPDQDAEWP